SGDGTDASRVKEHVRFVDLAIADAVDADHCDRKMPPVIGRAVDREARDRTIVGSPSLGDDPTVVRKHVVEGLVRASRLRRADLDEGAIRELVVVLSETRVDGVEVVRVPFIAHRCDDLGRGHHASSSFARTGTRRMLRSIAILDRATTADRYRTVAA